MEIELFIEEVRINFLSHQEFIVNALKLVGAITGLLAVYEALRTSRAAIESNEIQLLPFPIMKVRKDNTSKETDIVVEISNMGAGVAYELKIASWKVYYIDPDTLWEIRIKDPTINVLAKEAGDVKLDTEFFVDGVAQGDGGILKYSLLPNEYNLSVSPFILKFKNVRGDKYFSKVSISKDGIRVAKPPTRLTPVRNFLLLFDEEVPFHLKILFHKFMQSFVKRGILFSFSKVNGKYLPKILSRKQG